MRFLIQVWAQPAFDLPSPVALATGFSIRTVVIERPTSQGSTSLLIEGECERQSIEESPEPAFRPIGVLLSRLSFWLLTSFTVISARIVRPGLRVGDPVEELAFPGAPPGIALFEGKVGYKRMLRLDSAFLEGDVPANIEQAIGWFLLGLDVPNSVQQVLCHWIGIEALAPEVSGPWRCEKCRLDTPSCPHCDSPTRGPKTVQTIRAFLEDSLGVSRAEFKSLYKLRCDLSHGALGVDPEGIEAAASKAFRIQELLLPAIKRSLNWTDSEPPLFDSGGFSVRGAIGLTLRSIVQREDFYDQPGVYG